MRSAFRVAKQGNIQQKGYLFQNPLYLLLFDCITRLEGESYEKVREISI